MGLGGKTARGAAINIVAILARQGIQFLIVLPILARLLGPEAFGLIAMAMTLVAFLTLFNDVGLSTALVRADAPSDRLWSSAFWINAGMGVAMGAVALLSAPWLAAFYARPEVAPLAQAMAVVMVLHAMTLAPIAWLQREYRFTQIAMIDIASAIGSAAVAIAMGLAGFGVWALVGQQIAVPMIKLAGALALSKAPLGAGFDWAGIRAILPFSLHLTGSSIVGYLNRQADNLLVGRYLGAEWLGFYGRAYQIKQLPVQTLSQGANFALYPAMASVKHDLPRLGRMYLRLLALIGLVTIPLMAGLASVAEPFVRVLLGPRWTEMAPTLAFLCLAGGVQAINGTAQVLWKALGEAHRLMQWALIRLGFFLPAFAFGVWMGSTAWLAGAYLAAQVVLFLPYHAQVQRRLGQSLGDVLRVLAPATVASAVMVTAVIGADRGFEMATLAPVLRLGLLVGLGLAVFALVMATLFRAQLMDSLRELRHLRRQRGEG